jgi:hypothetical protein
MPEMNTAQLGAWGELIVQQDLLTFGIDSARMTTDAGIDLVAYDTVSKRSFSIQVKTRSPRMKGKRYSWGIEDDKCDAADLFALLITHKEHPERREDRWYLTRKEVRDLHLTTRKKGLVVIRFASTGTPKKPLKPMQEFERYRGTAGLMRLIDDFRTKKFAATAR